MKDTHLSVVILTIVISYTLAKSHTPFSGASLLSESERDSYKATDRHNHGKKGKSTRKNRHGNSDSGSLPTVSFQLDDILGRLQNLGVNTTDFISGSAGGFLLDLLERLESGEDLARAAGHDQVDVAILQADTVRSITAKGENIVIIVIYNIINYYLFEFYINKCIYLYINNIVSISNEV